MKTSFLRFALLFASGAQASNFVPQRSWPAATALELAESRFQIVNENMKSMIGWILYEAEGARKKEVAGISVDTLNVLESRWKKSSLVFASERKAPGTFMIDGQVRIAKTGSSFGSEIWVNRDLLVEQSDFEGDKALSIESIAAVLLHEYAHHLDQLGYVKYTHAQLDGLGAVLRDIFAKRNKTTEMGTTPPFRVEKLSQPLEFSFLSSLRGIVSYSAALVLLRDSERIWDLSPFWRAAYLGPDHQTMFGNCSEFAPSLENLVVRKLEKLTEGVLFTLEAMRIYLCFASNPPLDPDKYPRKAYGLQFKSTADGKLLFESLVH